MRGAKAREMVLGLSQRSTTFACIGLQFVISGIEYAVIFPTLNLYLEASFPGLSQTWLGLIIAAPALSGLLMGPLVGRAADRTQSTRWILLTGNVFLVLGSAMYVWPLSPLFLAAGRLVAGLGNSVGAALLTNLAWATSDGERTRLLSVFMGVRQLGLLIGPACNLFLSQARFTIGQGPHRLSVDGYSSPGLFLAALGLVAQLAYAIGYHDLHQPHSRQSPQPSVYTLPVASEEAEPSEEERSRDTRWFIDRPRRRVESLSEAAEAQMPPSPQPSPEAVPEDLPRQGWRELVLEVSREEMVVLLFSVFVFLLNQAALETALTPLTKKYYDFGEMENSGMYVVLGVLIVAVIVVVVVLAGRVADRVLLAGGMATNVASLALYVAAIPTFPPAHRAADGSMVVDWSSLPVLCVGVVLNVFGLPFVNAASASLLSKSVAKRNQGLVQGCRRSVINVAFILGPIWAAATIGNLHLLMGVMLALYLLACLLIGLSWPRLLPPTSQ